MQVLRTVVPGALLLEPGDRSPTSPAETPADPDAFVVRRSRRPDRGAVHGLDGNLVSPVLLGVPRGSGYAVVIDARPSAETFGRLAVALLDGTRTLLVPPGCLYGVQAVEDRVVVETHTATRPSKRERLAVDPDDPDLAIRWLQRRPARVPEPERSWGALCARLGAPTGPRRVHASLW